MSGELSPDLIQKTHGGVTIMVGLLARLASGTQPLDYVIFFFTGEMNLGVRKA